VAIASTTTRVSLAQPQDYVEALRAAFVLVDPSERRARIVAEVEAAAAKAGGSAHHRRQPGAGGEPGRMAVGGAVQLRAAFLAVPQEALIETMEINQKFFPVLDAGGTADRAVHRHRQHRIEGRGRSGKGYERVIRPRFADARFFFDEDLKQGLASMGEG
jgi:glycyl-tRNA synthetase beta chain